MNPSVLKTVARRLIRPKATVVVLLSLAAIATMIYSSVSAKRSAEEKYLSQFMASFTTGAAELCSVPQISLSRAIRVPDIGPLQLPRRTEYSITARYQENGVLRWGRWFYSCNARYNDGFYKFSHSTAPTLAGLPTSPGPGHAYIPWATSLVDGIPKTAGAAVSGLTVSSPMNVTDPLLVTASAPVGTVCRIEIAPPYAVMSLPAPVESAGNGVINWVLALSPRVAGETILVRVYCTEIRGTGRLENVTGASVIVDP